MSTHTRSFHLNLCGMYCLQKKCISVNIQAFPSRQMITKAFTFFWYKLPNPVNITLHNATQRCVSARRACVLIDQSTFLLLNLRFSIRYLFFSCVCAWFYYASCTSLWGCRNASDKHTDSLAIHTIIVYSIPVFFVLFILRIHLILLATFPIIYSTLFYAQFSFSSALHQHSLWNWNNHIKPAKRKSFKRLSLIALKMENNLI